jgi:glycosyltransferase involved in cell wall biosynthesis
LSKKTINFHVISQDKNVGYGKATLNMLEAFRRTGSTVNVTLPGRQAMVADIDFFLRPPPWICKTSRRKIAYFYWEALPLPTAWASVINSVDEIWAPCPLVAEGCRLAGFKGPIKIVPTPALPVDLVTIPSLKIDGMPKDSFVFYSISQWHNRKGWNELLSAYFDEFSTSDNVSLIIKTNPINSSVQHMIIEDIKAIKSKFENKQTARLVVIPNIISEQELLSIHKAGHCYVAPHHGEGWGMPIHDAIMFGKQIIATKFGGVVEFLEDDAFHPIPFSMVPVTGMEWNCAYDTYQRWAQPDVAALKSIMRDVSGNYKSYIWKNMLMSQSTCELSLSDIVELMKGIL